MSTNEPRRASVIGTSVLACTHVLDRRSLLNDLINMVVMASKLVNDQPPVAREK